MADLDARAVAQLATRLGLVTEAQLQETLQEVGPGPDPAALLLALERKGVITPLMTQRLLKGEVDGYFLGGYRLLYKIASGSFGRVYRADDPHSGQIVAIKVLKSRWSEDQHRIDLFDREGKVGLSLHHPNIVEVLAVDRDLATGKYYIVMEFVEGGNLREILAIRKKLEPAEALRIIDEAASGLAYAYSRGVTHRDVKLTNVLISSQGTAKLVDFGLAGLFASAGAHRGDGEVMDRTVDYAGLERATGVKAGDVRSDIYFLGCVLYETLTGRAPFDMTREARKRRDRHSFETVLPMKREEVAGPPTLFRLVEAMMSLNPQQRFQTPSQLLDAIREVRCDLEGKGAARAAPPTRSVFVVEKDERLQDAVRDKFKELGYRVFLAADPARAVERFRQHPFDALVLDAGTTGEDGLFVFERVMNDAEQQQLSCAGILVLSEDQADWASKVHVKASSVAVMVRPLTLKQLYRKLQDLVPASRGNGN